MLKSSLRALGNRPVLLRVVSHTVSEPTHVSLTAITSTTVTVSPTSDDHELDESTKSHRQQPNYFVALPICNTAIRNKLVDVQNDLIESQSRLKRTLVDVRTSHVTLMVIRLDEDHCLHDARQAMKDSVAAVKAECDFHSLTIDFEGLGSFKDQVLFAKPKEDDVLQRNIIKLAEIVARCFKKHGIQSTDDRPFTSPHLTIAKLSNAPEIRRYVKKIDKNYYNQFAHDVIGSEDVKVIQLCSMHKPKQGNGYYHVSEELPLFCD